MRSVVMLILSAMVGLVAGCQTSGPISVKDAYLVPAGESVGLVAQTNAAAVVMEVEVNLNELDIPLMIREEVAAQNVQIQGSAHLVFGADRVTNAPPVAPTNDVPIPPVPPVPSGPPNR